MSKEQFKYFAFISYNSRDTRWGKRLQRKLERYRMSATLCRERGWKKRNPIDPIFFAPTDIQPGDLSEELQKRLRESQHLIVICSPNSAKSDWVAREIEYFHSLGRTQNIHYFIVDGQPNSSNPETECFNYIVKELGLPEILGVNIHEKTFRNPMLNRERAYVQLISKLLNVEFDSLWKRHRRLMRQKIAAWTFGILAVLAAFIWLWIVSLPADVDIRLNEVSTQNLELPPLRNAVVTINIENETKCDTIPSIDRAAHFANIPHRRLGKPAHITVVCRDYLPVDTVVVLSKTVKLDMRRDSSVYGDIKFRLWDPNNGNAVPSMNLVVGDKEVTTDSDGRVSIFIPLEKQAECYQVIAPVPLEDDILHMPCSETTYLLLQ